MRIIQAWEKCEPCTTENRIFIITCTTKRADGQASRELVMGANRLDDTILKLLILWGEKCSNGDNPGSRQQAIASKSAKGVMDADQSTDASRSC